MPDHLDRAAPKRQSNEFEGRRPDADVMPPAAARVIALQRMAGNRAVARQFAPPATQPASPAIVAARDHLSRDEFEAAARSLLTGVDADIKTEVGLIDERALKPLRTASDRVGAADSHRLRTPVLERELLIWFGRDWDEYARLLNAFNDQDIRDKVSRLPKEGDTMTWIREAADRVNGDASFRIRAPILERQFGLATAAGVWGDSAGYLNGFNEADITKKFFPQLADEQLANIHQGAVSRGHIRLAG